MKLSSRLMIAITEAVAASNMTQAESARRLGVTQPRLNDLLRGRVGKFSLDGLVALAARAGLVGIWRLNRPVSLGRGKRRKALRFSAYACCYIRAQWRSRSFWHRRLWKICGRSEPVSESPCGGRSRSV